jgi:hypothetical protein
MARLFYNRHTPTNMFASNQTAGFEAANANLVSVEREYRSADLIGYQYLVADLGSLKRVSGVFVNGVNSDSCTPFYQYLGVNYRIANFYCYSDENKRVRGLDYAGKTLLAQSVFLALQTFATSLQAELTHDVVVQNPGAGICFSYLNINSGAGLVIAAGQTLKYDVKRAASNPDAVGGGMEIEFTSPASNGRSAGLVDQSGASLVIGPAGAANTWIARSIALTPIAGKTLTKIQVVNESDASGQHLCYYRNIRIENSNSTVALQAWAGVRTELNSVGLENLASGKLIAQGDTVDAAAFWRIANFDVFQDALDLPPFNWEYTVRTVEPFVGRALDNGLNPRFFTGPAYKIIKIVVSRFRLEDWRPFFAALKTGRCVLDMDLPGMRAADKWPVMLESLDIERARSSAVVDNFSFELREVVA